MALLFQDLWCFKKVLVLAVLSQSFAVMGVVLRVTRDGTKDSGQKDEAND